MVPSPSWLLRNLILPGNEAREICAPLKIWSLRPELLHSEVHSEVLPVKLRSLCQLFLTKMGRPEYERILKSDSKRTLEDCRITAPDIRLISSCRPLIWSPALPHLELQMAACAIHLNAFCDARLGCECPSRVCEQWLFQNDYPSLTDLAQYHASERLLAWLLHSYASEGQPNAAVASFAASEVETALHPTGLTLSQPPVPVFNGPSSHYKTRNLGAVYTPGFLAEWVAAQLVDALSANSHAFIIDPATGDGQLLKAVAEVAGARVALFGIDIDQNAVEEARRRLPSTAKVVTADALKLAPDEDATSPWRALVNDKPLVGVIANPPWGADLDHSQLELASLGYSLASGQFDIYDLFVELCITFAPEGSVLAFILPDSLFNPEHRPLRRLILSSTEILSISRLGEGFFSRVYRGTVVLLLRVGVPKATHEIKCFRLNKEWRRRILSGESSLTEAQSECGHVVRQSRFSTDPEARFDIDVRQGEETMLSTITASSPGWERWVQSGRGIELSKTGRVVFCSYCKNAHPLPADTDRMMTCGSCGKCFGSSDAEHATIIRPLQHDEAGWSPLIVGEDVDRYRCIPSRQIRTGITGINYKAPETFQQRKLLIRKTGIGIKAAIDESSAYTVQVVFHYFIRPQLAAPLFLLDYLQGILCSRVLLAYYLKRVGEIEWRSHPYITQKIISTLPIPDITEGTWHWRQAQAIAEQVQHRRMRDSNFCAEDIMIDCLVAGLYGLDHQQCQWVLAVLDEAESLEPIRTVRLPERNMLQPVRSL
jgi:adenine-specific DNA-methyltransferase